MSSAGAPATEPELRCRRRNHAQAGATRTNVHPSSSLVRAGDAMVAGGRRRRATRDARQVDGAKARVRAAASTSSRPPPPSRIASPRLPVQAPCSPTISYARWSWRRHQDQLSKSVRARAIHKMGISGAVDWWEEWQLRILVLGSLFVQYLLLCSAPFRKFAIPSWYRSIIWLAYVGSDALAIYALATLFNRHRKDYGSANSNSVLEVVWAPVLLMHLGGQSAITAYNIEDNELWTRHILTAVSQVTVAIYVFCKSWPGSDKRLLQASILFFATGIYKCIQKPWALKRASINSLVSSSDPTPRMTSMVGNTILLEEYVQEARDFVQGDKYRRSQVESDAVDLEHIHVPQAQGEAYELEDNHHHQAQGEGNNAAKLDLNHIPQINGKADVKMRVIKIREKERKFDLETRKIFVDLALSYPDRLDFLKYIWVLDKKKTCVFLRRGLFHTFDILYSRQTFNGHMELLREDAAAAQIRKEAAAVRKGSAAAAEEEESAAERSSGRKKRISTRKESAAERSSSRKKRIGTRKESAAAGAAAEVSFLDVFSYVLWAAAVYLPFTAIGLLHKSHREAYDVNDVKVTYALFCGTAVLEFLSGIFHLIVLCLSDLLILSGMVSQYSLVNFFVRNKRHSKKMCLLSSFNCKDFLDQRWCMKSCSSSFRITELVLGYVKCCWEKHIVDVASYRRFSDQRGQWTIQHKGCDQDQEWGLNRSFDESVLLWHIATDLCFYQKADTSACHVKATGCREISNYMIYLLFVKPEMLLPGTRRNLFKNANAELEKILKDDKPSLMAILKGNKPLLKFLKGKGPSPEETERRLVDRIIVKLRRTECREDLGCTEPPPDGERHPTAQQGSIHNTWQIFKSSLHTIIMQHIHFSPDAKKHPAAQERFIHDAWKLSELLLSLGDEKMWEVIEGVWVEMLCFSASRCRGYLHAKSLGTGGELLTHIWLLLSHMGMETLPERVQRRDLSSGGRNTGATPSSSKISTSTVEDMV